MTDETQQPSAQAGQLWMLKYVTCHPIVLILGTADTPKGAPEAYRCLVVAHGEENGTTSWATVGAVKTIGRWGSLAVPMLFERLA